MPCRYWFLQWRYATSSTKGFRQLAWKLSCSVIHDSSGLSGNNFPHHSTLDCTVYKHTCNRNRISTNTCCKANKKSKCQPTITISNTFYSLYRYIEKYQPQTARIRHVYTIVIEPTILIQPHRETVPWLVLTADRTWPKDCLVSESEKASKKSL